MDSRYFVPESELGDFTTINRRVAKINKAHVFRLTEKKTCGSCDSEMQESTLACAGCHAVYFCNQSCQKKHWKTHKAECPRHDKIGLNGIRFIASPIGLVSLQHHPLFLRATSIIQSDNGMPCAAWRVEPGRAFNEIIKERCGSTMVVDSAIYAQLLILAENWTKERFQFCIFTGSSPVWSQLAVFHLHPSTALTLLPKNDEIIDVFAHKDEESVLNHYQGPRQVNLVEDREKIGFYRGLLREKGAIRLDLGTWADQATIDMGIWSGRALESSEPLTLGSEKTWDLNKEFAKKIKAFCDNSREWKVEICDQEWTKAKEEPENQ